MSSQNAFSRHVRSEVRTISPQHTKLQASFKKHMAKYGFKSPNEKYYSVDLVAHHSSRARTFIEIKPCKDEPEARFATRIAIGQLLDYRWLEKTTTKNDVRSLLIVLGAKPGDDALAFAASLGIGCAWKQAGPSPFGLKWP
jgi:hypothetical protein